jgi:UDP-N-acetylmuramyl pentapeptide phosphotransferase/UDP-N-acetylglucosamine-1-phosphate transferase
MAVGGIMLRVAIELICIVALAALLTSGAIVLLRPLLVRYALAKPNARSSHKIPTPQGGGIAVVIAALVIALAFFFIDPVFGRGSGLELSLLAAASITLAVLGAVDDVIPLKAMPRLIVQFVAVAAMVAALPANLQVANFVPWWTDRLILVVAGVWFVNLVNFMDGIDWMVVVEVLPVTAGLAVAAYFEALPPLGMLVAIALFGAMIGFAPFNRPVANLFLGDVGSLPIGLILCWLLMQLAIRGYLAAALLLPLYFIADATITLIRRTINGEPITQAHRSHFYQLATERGWTVSDVVYRVFAVNVALAALAIATVARPSLVIDILALIIGGVLVGWLLVVFVRGKRA